MPPQGGGSNPNENHALTSLDLAAVTEPDALLVVHEALENPAALDDVKAEPVKLRLFISRRMSNRQQGRPRRLQCADGVRVQPNMNDDAHRRLFQSVSETTDRAVSAALAEVGSVKDLMEVTGAALGHLEQTMEGFRRNAEVKLDCRKGCSFCCWLNVDVRAHEVFLILRWLRARWSVEEMAALEVSARESRDAALGHTGEAKPNKRPCVLLRDSVCSVYEVRPAACRRYHSISVQACAELFETGDTEAQIVHPLLEEAGRWAARGVHHPFVRAGFDAYYYDLPSALAEALTDPSCEARWLEGQKAFSSSAESKVPPGYSQDEAVSNLKAALQRGER